jgi:hypothetical protein
VALDLLAQLRQVLLISRATRIDLGRVGVEDGQLRHAQGDLRLGISRLDGQGPLQAPDRRLAPALLVKLDTKMVVGFFELGLLGRDLLEPCRRRVEPPLLLEQDAAPDQSLGIIRLHRDGLVEAGKGLVPAPHLS